jgi:hypothetical protein
VIVIRDVVLDFEMNRHHCRRRADETEFGEHGTVYWPSCDGGILIVTGAASK